ncbi:MAG TPA: amino acid ABC transporter permease [Acidimicrobiales bacterium]|nr:amino acid ABC transporter permease [Acidimicrobiales bacterium]
MTAPFVADALGPRGRRLTLIASVISGVLIVAALVVAYNRLSARGQLDASRWDPFTQWPVWRFLLLGLVTTVRVAMIAMAGAILVGALMALARLSRTRPLRWAGAAYVEFFRGVPLVLLVFFSYLGLPRYGVEISAFSALTLALIIYNGAVLGEIFRAGILSLDRGQSEAAYSLGMTYWQSMLLVIIPQAARRMVPAIVSQLVTLLKDTSLGAAIGFEELLRRARITGEFFINPLQALVVAAAIYVVVNFTLSRVARRLELRQRRRYQAGKIAVAGIEDLAVLQAQGPAEPVEAPRAVSA